MPTIIRPRRTVAIDDWRDAPRKRGVPRPPAGAFAHKTRPLIVLWAAIALMLGGAAAMAQAGDDLPFYFGVDLSSVNEMEDCGALYRVQGQPVDPFALFAARGANLVRARLWHQPDWTDYSTLADVKRTFRRAQAAGMPTLLDIHYSDTWADPGRQQIPAAWAGLSLDELVTEVDHYTTRVLAELAREGLAELAREGLAPAFVQVGNETNSGILKDRPDQNWARDARLFNAGIGAVRAFDSTIKVVLHVAQPENTVWWFTQAQAAGVADFDVIGVSYYPQWSSFSIADLGAQVTALRRRFGKAVMIVETGYGWTRATAPADSANNLLDQSLPGYPFSPEGQHRFMIDLTQTLISQGALGVVYWEPAWVSTGCATPWGVGSHWENATFFDFQAQNEVIAGIDFLNHPYVFPAAR